MKKSDIIADALGQLDEKTLTIPEPPTKDPDRYLLPQIVAFLAAALVFVISLPYLRALLSRAPEGPVPAASGTETGADTEGYKDNNKINWIFITEGQPESEPGWNFRTDKVIDAEAQPYFPDLTIEECEITGHNAAIFPTVGVLEDYWDRLDGQGFTRLQCGNENLFYNNGVLIREQRCENPRTHTGDRFCVNVYVHRQTSGGVTADEAIGLINENCLKETITTRGGDNQIVEAEFTHDPVHFAVDITPSGFFALTGMQIFICPWNLPNNKFPYAVAFFVNENGAVKTDMGCDQKIFAQMSTAFYDIETCLSKDGYFGAPVLCDMDGDGSREMVLLTPYSTYKKSQVYLTVYDTVTPAVLAKSKVLTFKAENQELLYADGGHAVLHSSSDDGAIDEYFEVKVTDGQIALYDEYGKAVDLNLLPESPLDTDISPNEPYKFMVIDNDDEFVTEELVDEKTSLTQDYDIDRETFTCPLVFDVGGRKWIIGSEYSKNIVLVEYADGEFKDAGGYKFRYNSLAMLYMANRSDGRNVYASSGFTRDGIYRYDLLTGDVYTFIKTKNPCSSPYYVNGVLLYVSVKNNVYTLKAAVLSEKNIYRICQISSGDHPSVMLTDNGAFAVIGKTVYFMGLNGKVEKIAELPGTGMILETDGEKLYAYNRKDHTLAVVDRRGNTLTRNVEGEYAEKICNSSNAPKLINICRGALVSCYKKADGSLGLYLYHPDADAWEDLSCTPGFSVNYFSFCVESGSIYVMAAGGDKACLMIYPPEQNTPVIFTEPIR